MYAQRSSGAKKAEKREPWTAAAPPEARKKLGLTWPYVIKLVARSLHRSTLIRRMAALSCKFLRLAGSLIIGGAPEGAGSATKNHENTQGRGRVQDTSTSASGRPCNSMHGRGEVSRFRTTIAGVESDPRIVRALSLSIHFLLWGMCL